MESTPTASPARWRLLAAYAAVYLIWGSTYLGIRFAVETIPPLLMAGSRFVVAGSVLYGVLRLRGVPPPSRRQWGGAVAVGLLLIAIGNGAVSWAEQVIPSSIAALLVATVPLWIALLEALRARRWPPARAWVGIALGVVGVAVLVGEPEGWEGDAAALVAALAVVGAGWAWAAGSVLSRAVARPGSALLAASMHMLAGGVALVVAGVAVGERVSVSSVSAVSALAWAYLVVLGSLVAFTAYVWLLQVDSPTRVATYAYVNPLIAVLLGWALAAEPLTPRVAVAGAAVVAAVALILRVRRTPAPAPPASAPASLAQPRPGSRPRSRPETPVASE